MIKYTLELIPSAKIVRPWWTHRLTDFLMPIMVALLALGRCYGLGLWALGSFETTPEIYYIVSLGMERVSWLKISDYESS